MNADRRVAAAHVFVEPHDLAADDLVPVDEQVHHHLVRVLRLRDGEFVSASDGAGCWRLTTVVRSGDSLRLEPASGIVCDAAPPTPLTIATAIPKGDRLDWLVQKTTELGVDRLQLIECDRSVVRWRAERVDKHLGRLRRISEEAARQSRRTRLVEIVAPVPALDVLSRSAVAEPGGRVLTARDRQIAIGPEGGWSDDELAAAMDTVKLGDNILRTETAALAAAALCVAHGH